MKVYLDTSVINIRLFGKYSRVEAHRFSAVAKVFRLINSKKITAIVSIYTLQEIYSFCKKTFSPDDVGHVSRISLLDLLKNEFELSGLLTREERLLHKTRFVMEDLSDQPHAISAFLNKCDAVMTYDKHFRKINNTLHVYTPEEILLKFSSENTPHNAP